MTTFTIMSPGIHLLLCDLELKINTSVEGIYVSFSKEFILENVQKSF